MATTVPYENKGNKHKLESMTETNGMFMGKAFAGPISLSGVTIDE